jgi:hypothetical protein
MAVPQEEFEEFVSRVVGPKEPFKPLPHFKVRNSRWQQSVEDLYTSIEEYLSKYITAGTVRLTYSDTEISEDYVGTYSVRKLLIEIGTQHIRLVPVGTVVIFAESYVDVVGSSGLARLALFDEAGRRPVNLVWPTSAEAPTETEERCAWKIAARPPAVGFVPLDRRAFLEVLLEVSNA